MLATARKGIPHLEVTFNENKQPVLKRQLNSDHELIHEEMFVYDESNTLHKRLFLDGKRRTEKIINYGEQEPWSVEFRKYSVNKKDAVSFIGQQTEFVLSGSEEISDIIFRTVDNHEYGTIHLSYDHLGFLQEEIWRILPKEKVIRKFIYDFDIINDVQQIWEYGRKNQEISHVALSMAPEDKLYTTPPPRTGNVLDEADIILKELISKKVVTSLTALIPKTEWDRLKLTYDEEMDIIFVSINNDRVRFSLPYENEVLSISLDRVSSIRNKYGELIYP
jgi:hypothetical protein